MKKAIWSVVIHGETRLFALWYIPCLFVTSVFAENIYVPPSFLSYKESVLNEYFMTGSYYYLCVIFAIFSLLTSSIYCLGNWRKISRHTFRPVAIVVIIFFIHVQIKDVSRMDFFGQCTRYAKVYLSKEKCQNEGYAWDRFNISGHALYLMFWILMIMEEASVMRRWSKIGTAISKEIEDRKSTTHAAIQTRSYAGPLGNLSDGQIGRFRLIYTSFTPVVRILYATLVFFVFVYYVCLASTVLYFHSVLEKMWGGIIGVVLWYIFYSGYVFYIPGEGSAFWATNKEYKREDDLKELFSFEGTARAYDRSTIHVYTSALHVSGFPVNNNNNNYPYLIAL